ncbi:MAG: tRNA (adenosine(37)-N6)-threonylcarbamoyltransferase complex transferase subunit TsaD [Verrucomicrobiales bacterium]|nr:tRNA (adenosine(37)-N6)-threonylcarbamoyltransferase complex transferase subunit TsaD [Verrucomicrobiales bacterium]
MLLAIESSCDETAASVLSPPSTLLASEIASQVEKHRPYGGVVPELASRNHLVLLEPIISQTLKSAGLSIDEIQAFAATSGPGLSSSLLMGNTTAKALALASNKPFISVNHIEGHLCSPFMEMEIKPHIALIVSGGHTLLIKVNGFNEYETLGSSLDDAAGEAFDKVGKMLGLPYPGGPEVEKLARHGDPKSFDFPRSMINRDNSNFSFSGLKTSVLYALKKIPNPSEQIIADLCASFQIAVVEILIHKATQAALKENLNTIALSGGVACNLSLRQALEIKCQKNGLELIAVDYKYSTDNAAMIARAAAERFIQKRFTPLSEDVNPNLRI